MASACATMLIIAAGLVFRKRTRQTGALAPDAIAIGHGCHCSHCSRCGGRVEQSRSHDQEDGVSIVGEAGPRRGRQDPSHQDCIPRSAARSGTWTTASIRGLRPLVHRRAPCAFGPHTPRTSGAHVGRGDVRSYEGLGPCLPPPDRHVLSTRTSGASRRRTESPSWLEKEALTGTCPSTP
jgi:hypothetical protein